MTHETSLWEPAVLPLGTRGAELRIYHYCAVINDYGGDQIVLDWEELRALLKTLVVHATPQLSTKETTHARSVSLGDHTA